MPITYERYSLKGKNRNFMLYIKSAFNMSE